MIWADFKSAARRPEELAYLAVTAIAAGLLGSHAGKFSVLLVALLSAQLASYFYIIKDWDRGVLEGLVYYAGYLGIYASKLVIVAVTSAGSTLLASLFIGASSAYLAASSAVLISTLSALAALLAAYGGLPPPVATAMSVVLSLPPLESLVQDANPASLFLIPLAAAVGAVAAGILDRPSRTEEKN